MFCVIRSAGFLPSAGVVHHFLACNVHVIDFCLFFFFFERCATEGLVFLEAVPSTSACSSRSTASPNDTTNFSMVFLSCPGWTRSGGTFFLTCPDLLLSSRPCLLLLLLPPPPTPPPPLFVCLPFLTSQTTRNGVWPPPDKLSIRFFLFSSQPTNGLCGLCIRSEAKYKIVVCGWDPRFVIVSLLTSSFGTGWEKNVWMIRR